MDDQSVRAQLVETKARLKIVEEEREILLSLIHGFEGWLRINLGDRALAGVHQPAMLPETVIRPSNARVGTISMRAAVRQVLRDAHGSPLHTKEIYRRVSELGAKTTAGRPESVVDLTALTLSKNEPIERISPRTWRWTGNAA